jgi:hypothetical protein
MDFLIYLKWCSDWTTTINSEKSPPSIISLMIDIPLNFANPGPVPFWGDGEQ